MTIWSGRLNQPAGRDTKVAPLQKPQRRYAERLENSLVLGLDKHAPLGPKKLMNLFRENRVALNPEHLTKLRKLQQHDLEEQLDNLVEKLGDETLVVGEIKDTTKQLELVGKIVDLYLHRLRSALSGFSWQSSVEGLIGNNEAVHHERVLRSFTMATDIACFSDIASRVEREKDAQVEINTTAVATRTLIEFVAAEPPGGTQPVSTDELDQLLAIACHLFEWGSLYDQIELGVLDHHLSILGSGRVGQDPVPLERFKDTFVTEKVREYVEYAIGSFRTFIDPQRTEQNNADLGDISNALAAEFGLTMAQVAGFHAFLIDIGFREEKAWASLPLSELKEAIKDRTKDLPDWTDADVDHAIELFSLKPRKAWDAVPNGFLKSDIYPWRYLYCLFSFTFFNS